MSQIEILTIMKKERELDLKELNKHFSSRSTLSKTLDRLIKQKYLKKIINPKNKAKRIIIYMKNASSGGRGK